jgi:hypothetical protein
MRICIDSNQFILGIAAANPDAAALMEVLPKLEIVLPRLVVLEVVRNLERLRLDKQFFLLLGHLKDLSIVDDPIPEELVTKYVALGLPDKADAFIGAFSEWVGASYLISDNRHFLSLATEAFRVLPPGEFLSRLAAEEKEK